jgi:hypothetical protein
MDFIAIASLGFYPTPTPTGQQRAAYVATYGLLNLLPAGVTSTGRGLNQFGFSMTFK